MFLLRSLITEFGFTGFSKVLLVMHPFLRLAKSYHQIFDSKDQASKELTDIKSRLEKYIKENQGQVDFEVSALNLLAQVVKPTNFDFIYELHFSLIVSIE